MKKYIFAILFTVLGTGAKAQDWTTTTTDLENDVSIVYHELDSIVPTVMTANTTETKQPAEAPSDGAIHTMTLYLLDGTQVTYNEDDLDNVTYLPGVGMKVYVTGSTTSVDYLYSQMTKIVYSIGGSTPPADNNVNANWNITGMNIPQSGVDPTFSGTNTTFNQSSDNWAWRLEYPHINTSSSCQRVVKASRYKDNNSNWVDCGIDYSLEWDNSKIANRWTCYTMCAKNNANNVTRSDDFKADPEVTTSATSSYTQSNTYSRGHLCPSADRLASTTQNKQTFYMTNMQPQYQSHNGGMWATLEGYVRTKWQPTNSNDTLYVVKAATIENVTFNGSSQTGIITTTTDSGGHTLVVPKYFYMAFLYYEKSTNKYKAFALWTEQKQSNNDSADTVINNRITIDELEARTGIDFFCNLPDDIEAEVESAIDPKTQKPTYWDNSSNNN